MFLNEKQQWVIVIEIFQVLNDWRAQILEINTRKGFNFQVRFKEVPGFGQDFSKLTWASWASMAEYNKFTSGGCLLKNSGTYCPWLTLLGEHFGDISTFLFLAAKCGKGIITWHVAECFFK